MGAERSVLMLYRGVIKAMPIKEVKKGELEAVVVRNIDKEHLDSDIFKVSRNIIKKVEQTQKGIVITDAAQEKELRQQESVIKYGLHSILCVPLKIKDTIIGAIYLDNSLVKGLFTEDDLSLMEFFAAQAGISIENARLYKILGEKMQSEKEMATRIIIAEEDAKFTAMLRNKNKALEEAYNELKAAQQQLIQTAKMATLGTLAGGVAHEINNPLGAILINTQMLLKKNEDKDFGINLKLIEAGSQRCKEIVEKLLKYSRKSDKEEFFSIDLNEVISDTCRLVQSELEKESIFIAVNYGKIPNIKANSNELSQVFMNMLINSKNAIGKIKKGGTITITTRQEKNSVIVKVADDGCGIPAQIIEKIFDPFFTTMDTGKGTGLGLSLSQKIIERHQGSIKVESKPKKGSVFTINLPKAGGKNNGK